MNQKHSSSATIAKGALSLFALVVVLVNAFVTWQFGSYYLNHAFGIQQPAMAAIVGGAYAVTFLDVASLVWLFAFMRLAETSAQRGIALAASIIAFVGSLLATVYMLASGTAGALSAYTESISTAAQIAMIAIVVTHAVLLVLYLLRGRGEMVTQTTINATTSATGEALTLAASNVQNMVPRLAQDIGAAIETQILAALSFTRQHDGRLVYMPTEKGDAPTQLSATTRPAPVRDDGWRPYPYSTGDAQENIRPPQGQPVRQPAPPPANAMSPQLAAFLKEIGQTPDELRSLARQYGLTDAADAYRAMKQYGYLPDGLSRAEFNVLFRELMNGGTFDDDVVNDVQPRFHTIYSDEHGDVPISTDLTRAEFNAAIEAAERAKRDGATRPTNGRNGAH